jgi:hypothetical protein
MDSSLHDAEQANPALKDMIKVKVRRTKTVTPPNLDRLDTSENAPVEKTIDANHYFGYIPTAFRLMVYTAEGIRDVAPSIAVINASSGKIEKAYVSQITVLVNPE